MSRKIGLVAFAAVCVVAMAILGLKAVATIAELPSLGGADQMVRARAGLVVSELHREAQAMLVPATELASQANFGTELRIIAGLQQTTPGPLSRPLRGGVGRGGGGTLGEHLTARVAAWREQGGGAATVTFVDAAGRVVWTESPRFSEGSLVTSSNHAVVASDVGAVGEADEAVLPLVADALDGRTATGVLPVGGSLYLTAAVPIFMMNGSKRIGAVVLERRLERLPVVAAVTAFLALRGSASIGKPPAAAVAAGQAVEAGQSFFVQTTSFTTGVASFLPVFIETEQRHGYWGHRFALPGTQIAWGAVLSEDVSPLFDAVAERQQAVVMAALILWLLLGTAAWFVVPAGAPVEDMARLLVRLERTEAGVEFQEPLDPGEFRGELAAVVAEINRLITEASALGEARPAMVAAMDEPAGAVASHEVSLDLEALLGADLAVGLGTDLAAGLGTGLAAGDAGDAGDAELGSVVRDKLELLSSGPSVGGAVPVLGDLLDTVAEDGVRPVFWRGASGLSDDAAGRGSAATTVAEPDELDLETALAEQAAGDAASAAGFGGGDESQFKDVFDKFVATRRRCGEPGEVSFDQFVARLVQSRAAVMATHACRDVRFCVYVKNGKAALKATPAR